MAGWSVVWGEGNRAAYSGCEGFLRPCSDCCSPKRKVTTNRKQPSSPAPPQVCAAIESHLPGSVPGATLALAAHLAAEAAAPAPAAPAAPANGTAEAAPAPAAAAANSALAASLNDLGLALGAPPAGGAAANGTTASGKGQAVRAYMDSTVVPVLREGLRALNSARPEDPLQFLAEFILAQRKAVGPVA